MQKKKLDEIATSENLLARLRQGDPQAVAEWFSTYHDRLYTLVLSRVSEGNDAEELVQEIFLNCLKGFNIFRGESSLWTWMCSVARHEIADYYRKRYAKNAIKTLPLVDFLISENVLVRDSHQVSQKVTDILRQMSSHYRELLLLKYVDGMKVAVIAVQLQKTAKAIESDLFRAREEFRALWLLQTEKEWSR
jgi:RNA polymerase sigma-70 factor, ECF subfamily